MDPRSGGDLDEETVARKRSRRVSFADTTAVHVFDRDEDFETPPTDSKISPGAAEHEFLGFRGGDHSDTDESKGSRDDGDDDEEEEEVRFFKEDEVRFFKDMDSSPGSAVGSVTSNDDNFFGPVSTSFINSGRLSESGMSEDGNHDITLDSTAFSLHFQNIAPPDSANSLKSLRTPTDNSMPTSSPDSVVPKGFIQHVPRSNLSHEKLNDTPDTSAGMSIIVENQRSYDDYEKMSPTLQALLSEAKKQVHDNPTNGIRSIGSKVRGHEGASRNEDTTTRSVRATGNAAGDIKLSSIPVDTFGNPCCNVVASPSKVEWPSNSTSVIAENKAPLSPKILESLINVSETIQTEHVTVVTDMAKSADENSHNILMSQSSQAHVKPAPDKVRGGKHDSDSSPEVRPPFPAMASMNDQKQALVSELGMYTPKDAVKPLPTSLFGSISSLRAKRQQLFDPAVLSQTRLTYTPERPPSSLKADLMRFGERASAVKNHISKFIIAKSPNNVDSESALVDKDPLLLEHTLERVHKDLIVKPSAALGTETVANFQEASVDNIEPNNLVLQAADTLSASLRLGRSMVTDETVKMSGDVPPFRFPQSDINRENHLSPYLPMKHPSASIVQDSSQSEGTVQFNKSMQEEDIIPKVIGTTTSSAFFNEDGTPLENSHYLPSNKSPHQNDNSRNCSYPRQAELKSPVSLKERERVKYNRPALDVALKEDLTTTKSKKLTSDVCPQSPKNTNYTMVHSYNQAETVQSEPSKDPMPSCHDISKDGQQYMKEVRSIEDKTRERKRAFEQILVTEKDRTGDLSRSQKIPRLLSSAIDDSSGIMGQNLPGIKALECFGSKAPQKPWRDIISSLSDITSDVFSSAVRRLKFHELDISEDALSELHNGRKYERISASLRSHAFSGVQKREVELRLLLDKLVYEKAKVQLKRIKLDQLSHKAQLCRYRSGECDKLKSIYSRLCEQRNVQERNVHGVSSNDSRSQEETARVASMRTELEMMEREVKLLVNSFEASCKIKGKANNDVIIDAVKHHLDKTSRCRAIQHGLQLWKLSNVAKNNDCISIILNYRNLLERRYQIRHSTVSNTVANCFLIDANIEKNFPRICASIAFQFIFKDKGNGKVTSLIRLQQEKYEADLLFGTLLDVLEDIIMSKMGLGNLISSTFQSRHADQLELQLCFLSSKSCNKVPLSLDLTSLNCAVYPSEPSDLRIQIPNEVPPSISNEIKATVMNLPSGSSMIFRMCQSISQVVNNMI